MVLKFRLNRYNWLGQKLLAQHQYNEIARLHQYLATDSRQNLSIGDNQVASSSTWPTSEHLGYVYAVTLMRTSSRLDEVIHALQRMNFDRNSQYFLLLCQSLLYLGNYDSVVALCKQVFNKEIGTNLSSSCLTDDETTTISGAVQRSTSDEGASPLESLLQRQESFEFGKVFASISSNHLLNEPRIWFIFGQALEYQRQFRDASFAYRVATQLASGGHIQQTSEKLSAKTVDESNQVSMNDYYLAHLRYAELCFRHKRDFKSAIQVLLQASCTFPKNYLLTTLLALMVSAQPNSNQSSFTRAIELIAALEAHSNSSRNPSESYNRLAAKCLQKQSQLNTLAEDAHLVSDAGDENRSRLGYLLIKSYIIANSLAQNPDISAHLFTGGKSCGSKSTAELSAVEQNLMNQVDKLVEALRCSHNDSWDCASIWNNLGLCYLMKRRFIACITCFVKALHLNPLDWRINYNLSLACLHTGLTSKALVTSLASRSQYLSRYSSASLTVSQSEGEVSQVNHLITTLTAICYDKLNLFNESRRLYIEAIRSRKSNLNATPILPLINYLVFLDRHTSPDDEEQEKMKLHLLDQLEQSWLQRNQGDSQFNQFLLDTAADIGERSLSGRDASKVRTFAWVKHQQETNLG